MRKVLLIIFFYLQYLSIVGCTLIGFTAGSFVDDSKPEYYTCKVSEIDRIEKGSEIEITFKNGRKIFAELLSIEQNTFKHYDSTYQEFKISEPNLLPLVGDTIQIFRKSKSGVINVPGIFIAFDYNAMRYKPLGSNSINYVRNNRLNYIEYKNNKQIQSINSNIDSLNVPLLSELIIQSNDNQHPISLAEISEIKIYNKKIGRVTGVAIGAALDIAAFTIIRNRIVYP